MKGARNTKLYEWQQRLMDTPRTCARCLKFGLKLTVDHIVPVEILKYIDDSGTAYMDDEENFQYLCQPCNNFKANKLDKTNPKTKEILLKYL